MAQQHLKGNLKLREAWPKAEANFTELFKRTKPASEEEAGLLTPEDKAKLDGIEDGAQVNQNAFAKVNDLEASDPSDTVTITGGTGITTTTNPNTKEVIITATGEATPGPHGSSHTEFGSDPIPYATETDGGLMSAEDKQKLTELEGLPQEIKKKTMPVFNVDGYGALGAPHDDYSAIKAALDDAEAAGGGIVYFPGDEYMTGTTLSWTSDNVKLVGNGGTLLRDHPDLGANRIIYLKGTPEEYIKNTKFEGITFRNGTATSGNPTVGKDCIRAEYVDGLMIRKCKFTEVQGNYGLVVKYARDVKVINSKFHRWTDSAMFCLVGCENIRVYDNEFDTALSTSISQTYTFGTGGESLGEGDFFIKNLWVEGNRFLNNPRWEGIDCHGGENIWIRDNYIENCKMGIMARPSIDYVSNPVLKNVTIEGNTIIQGTGQDGEKGIVAGGTYEAGALYLAEHIVIRNNKVVGFGGTADSISGSVQVYWATDVTIENNEISEYEQYGINLYGVIWGVKVRDNKIKNCRGGFTPAITAAICVNRTGGVIDALIENNDIDADDEAKRPAYGMSSENQFLSAQIRNNTIRNVATSLYRNPAHLPVEKAAIPDIWLIQKYGDVVYSDTGKPGWYATNPKIGYASLNTAVVVTADIEKDSMIATIVSNGTGAYWALPPGMNIVIAGAGEEGGDLLARILKNDGTNLTLDTAAGTTVSGANLTYQTLTLSA